MLLLTFNLLLLPAARWLLPARQVIAAFGAVEAGGASPSAGFRAMRLTSTFGGSSSTSMPPRRLPSMTSSNFPSRSWIGRSILLPFMSARTPGETSGRWTAVASLPSWSCVARAPRGRTKTGATARGVGPDDAKGGEGSRAAGRGAGNRGKQARGAVRAGAGERGDAGMGPYQVAIRRRYKRGSAAVRVIPREGTEPDRAATADRSQPGRLRHRGTERRALAGTTGTQLLFRRHEKLRPGADLPDADRRREVALRRRRNRRRP